ncbi:hypothetical protein F4777DRAFT_579624 [Nemania sp. FL0916]|nr:hypothetical protein F4777DRAFT_579624 [Nemania sp. FL0916]
MFGSRTAKRCALAVLLLLLLRLKRAVPHHTAPAPLNPVDSAVRPSFFLVPVLPSPVLVLPPQTSGATTCATIDRPRERDPCLVSLDGEANLTTATATVTATATSATATTNIEREPRRIEEKESRPRVAQVWQPASVLSVSTPAPCIRPGQTKAKPPKHLPKTATAIYTTLQSKHHNHNRNYGYNYNYLPTRPSPQRCRTTQHLTILHPTATPQPRLSVTPLLRFKSSRPIHDAVLVPVFWSTTQHRCFQQ